MAKYTFLLPAYKSTFFEESLRSIKNQSYTDFYVLVSDDCSPENLREIFDRVVGDDSRFSYRRNEKNMGSISLVSHWNLLVGLCETDYLIMASDDDVYAETFLEEIDYLVCKYTNCDVFRARANVIDKDKNVVREDFNLDEYLSQRQFLICFDSRMVLCLANYVFRTVELKEIGGFIEFPLAMKSDSATVMLMAKKGVAVTKDILFTFRMSGANLSSIDVRDKQKFRQIINGNRDFVSWYKKNILENLTVKEKIDAFYVTLCERAHRLHVMKAIVPLLGALTFSEVWNLMRELRSEGYLEGKRDCYVFLKSWFDEM